VTQQSGGFHTGSAMQNVTDMKRIMGCTQTEVSRVSHTQGESWNNTITMLTEVCKLQVQHFFDMTSV